jgi:hypothetical protein
MIASSPVREDGQGMQPASASNRGTGKMLTMTRNSGWQAAEPLQQCRAALHQRAFLMTHALDRKPLFTTDALLRVAHDAAARRGDVYFDAGDVGITDKWGQIPVPEWPVEEVIKRIEHAGAWVVIKHVETDPAYAEVLREWADFMHAIAGEGAHLLRNPEMLVFVTSPRRITPFHFDAEVNVLVQIHGRKTLWVCGPDDRSVVAETDIENYYGISITSGSYKPHAEAAATAFDLVPGDAIHIPTHSAHWVRNLDEVSVSLSLNFELPRATCADVYLANYYLRRLGVTPRPPGRSKMADTLKASAIQAGRTAKQVVRRRGRTAQSASATPPQGQPSGAAGWPGPSQVWGSGGNRR